MMMMVMMMSFSGPEARHGLASCMIGPAHRGSPPMCGAQIRKAFPGRPVPRSKTPPSKSVFLGPPQKYAPCTRGVGSTLARPFHVAQRRGAGRPLRRGGRALDAFPGPKRDLQAGRHVPLAVRVTRAIVPLCFRVTCRLFTQVTTQSIASLLPLIEDRLFVLRQCATRIPGTVAAAQALFDYASGVCRNVSPLDDEALAAAVPACRELFDLYGVRLAAYARLYPGGRLEATRWRWFSAGSIQDVAAHLALEGDAASLCVLASCFPSDLEGRALLKVLSSLPETIKPRWFDTLLPVSPISHPPNTGQATDRACARGGRDLLVRPQAERVYAGGEA